jgi:hypothetical protein
MGMNAMRDFLANIVAAAHISHFLFILGGVVTILIGPGRGWKWIRNVWLRFLHIAAVSIVPIEDVFNIQCPLNTLEWRLRSEAPSGVAVEATTGIGGALDYLLRHTVPGSVLHVFYWAAAAFAFAAQLSVAHFGTLRGGLPSA